MTNDTNRLATETVRYETVRYGYSQLTSETWYRVHDWEDLGDGKMVAKKKEEVDPSEVPKVWKGAIMWSIEESRQEVEGQ